MTDVNAFEQVPIPENHRKGGGRQLEPITVAFIKALDAGEALRIDVDPSDFGALQRLYNKLAQAAYRNGHYMRTHRPEPAVFVAWGVKRELIDVDKPKKKTRRTR